MSGWPCHDRRGGHRGVLGWRRDQTDADCLPPVVEAVRAQKAQQAAARLKAGQGAAEPGLDYVFTGPEMLFTVYARFIPNRTRRDGSALLARMTAEASHTGEIRASKDVGRS